MSESLPVDDSGVISRQGVLDLSHLTSPEQLAAIRRLERVGTVVLPQSLAAAYTKIPASRVGATIYVPDGEHVNVRSHIGPLVVGGDGLGAPTDVLVVTGILVITSPVTGPLPSQISVVGSVLAPRGSESALGPALAGGTGTVSYYPYAEGQEVKVLTGQVPVSGASLANPAGQPEDILVVAGQMAVTGPVPTVGYRQVVVAGQLAAPAAAREVLEPRLHIQGQAGWYRGEEAQVLYEGTVLAGDFFRLLPRPVSLVLFDDVTVGPGAAEATVQEKVTDIVLFGDLTAPPDLVPVLQVLTTDAFGTIRASDGPGS